MMEPIVTGHYYIMCSHDLYYFTHTSDLVGLLCKTPVEPATGTFISTPSITVAPSPCRSPS